MLLLGSKAINSDAYKQIAPSTRQAYSKPIYKGCQSPPCKQDNPTHQADNKWRKSFRDVLINDLAKSSQKWQVGPSLRPAVTPSSKNLTLTPTQQQVSPQIAQICLKVNHDKLDKQTDWDQYQLCFGSFTVEESRQLMMMKSS
ncbi:hypothetical protein ACFE04_005242 [Oxalis oulophora]